MIKIEVIIAAYNCRNTLHRTLASLESQTDSNFYVHIIDDCSTEDFSDIIKYHNKLDIKVTRNKLNLGAGMSKQVGIDMTDADYIAFLDSDDVLMPYTVEIWRNMATSSPSTDVFHSYFYEQKIEKEIPVLKLIQNGYTWIHGKLYKTSFIKHYDIRHNQEIKYMDDSYFNSMCTELGKVSIIPLPMYMWLNNHKSLTRDGKMTSDACRYDFIHGMILSTQFLINQGVKTIRHMDATLKNLEQVKPEFSDNTLREYEKLLTLLKSIDCEVNYEKQINNNY